MDSGQALWQRALDLLKNQVSREIFETFLKGTSALRLEGDTLIISCPDAFRAEYVQQRLLGVVQSAVEEVGGRPLAVRVEAPRSVQEAPRPAPPPAGAPLNPKYTFATFIVGESNRLAHAAAQAVAERPGQRYNPLFLYSEVGLGKTHLLHAIGHRLREQGLAVVYVSAEQFTNEFIDAIRRGEAEAFRQRYRSVDALLVDDIHFLIGKEQTQEGFFHTFNELHNANRQIVLTCDRPPRALTPLADRLRSRFEWGLIVDIQPPDLETRLAILRAKAEALGVRLPEEVLHHLGRRVYRNIRELEGALNRVVAFADLTGEPITLALAVRALAEPAEAHRPPLDPEEVIRTVADYYGVEVSALRGPGRHKKLALARQVAMYLLREDAGRSLTEIGRLLGGKDHSTVLHACQKIAQEIDLDPHLRQDLLALRDRLERSAGLHRRAS